MTGAALTAIPLAPLIAAVLALLFARSRPGLGGVLLLAGNVLALVGLLATLGAPAALQVAWFTSGTFQLTAGLALDALSRWMAFLVAGVALIVNVYALGYMADHERRGYFFAAMSFFLAAMLTLVLSSSFVLLFAAWEAIGVASFVLIGFYFREPAARTGAQRAFLLTRVGDVGLLLAWLIALASTGSTRIDVFLEAVGMGDMGDATLTLLALLFFAGAIGKSAQLPLTPWLPAAMVGPTPVSALIHSATLVAAGVYLVLRLYSLFQAAPYALTVVLWVGIFTALLAALVATAQRDMKRVAAWSTSSQLGEMMMALGLAGPLAAAFHLSTHAAFKSAWFLGAGAVDRATGSHELNELGGLARRLPTLAAASGVAVLALAAVPPFSGYWSTEKILASAAQRGPLFAVVALLITFLAATYAARLYTAAFLHRDARPERTLRRLPTTLWIGLVVLTICAATVGWLLHDAIGRWLPYPDSPHLALAWRVGALLCVAGGLAFGFWRVQARGPVPALGAWVLGLHRAAGWLVTMPAHASLAAARFIGRLEQVLDRATTALGRMTLSIARAEQRSEVSLDTLGRGCARATLRCASLTRTVELAGFGDLMDALGRGFARGGEAMRPLQSGRLYQYTLALAGWVLATVLVAVLLW